VAPGDDVLGIGDDSAVVEKDVDVVLRRQQRADIALQNEVGTIDELDGLGDFPVGGMDQVADLAADDLLPLRQGVDVRVDAWVTGVRNGDVPFGFMCLLRLRRVTL
jgi:hypothetical protein